MSVTKTKKTKFHTTDQPVKFKLSQLNIKSIENKQSISLHGVLVGTVDDTDGQVDKAKANLGLSDITSGFSATEITAAKKFLKACEREIAQKVAELKDEAHDESDVFA